MHNKGAIFVDNRVQIFEAPDSISCSNYLCGEMFGKKFYVGNFYGSSREAIYCEACVRHLVDHLPAELVPEMGELENRLRTEITVEYEIKLAQILNDRENALREQAAREIAIQLASQEKIEDIPFTEEVDDANADPITYRCLDCNEEFDTPQKLGSHRRKHLKAGK